MAPLRWTLQCTPSWHIAMPQAGAIHTISGVLSFTAIGDRGPDLRGAIRGAGVEPVEAFAARDVRLQVSPVVDRGPALGRVGMLEPVAPVRQRHVVVDPDEIDLRIGPERIEVEEHVATAIAGLMPEILRPVGSIADLRSRPEDRAHIAEEVPVGLHGGISAGPRADRGQPRHLGAIRKASTPPAAAQRWA